MHVPLKGFTKYLCDPDHRCNVHHVEHQKMYQVSDAVFARIGLNYIEKRP